VILVGETFTGKSKTLKVVRNILNRKYVEEFRHFYTSKMEDRGIRGEEERKTTKADNYSIFRQFLNACKEKVEATGVVDLKTLNPKIYTIEEL